jgi:tRNA G10  N-methylase Trm11
MTSYLFIFGRTPELSAQELNVFYPGNELIHHDIALVNGELSAPEGLIQKLGGTTKIAEISGEYEDITAELLAEIIINTRQNHLTFGLSWYGNDKLAIKNMTAQVKDILSEKDLHSRFVMPEHGNILSSVVVDKQNVIELNICTKGDKFIVAKTVATQPYEEWNKRDYGRPYSDAKHGMLPPKVARMALNIALGPDFNRKVIADPFCGMGTVLAEALIDGAEVQGSDISESAVVKAQKNIDWLKNTYSLTDRISSFQTQDAVHLSEIYQPESIDAIVTEPFMGSPEFGEGKINPEKAKNIIKGLEKMYLGCLKNWHDLLKNKGKICIAFPSIKLESTIINVKRPIDTCENLGYTKVLGPIAYGREQAVVSRNFYLFEKKE